MEHPDTIGKLYGYTGDFSYYHILVHCGEGGQANLLQYYMGAGGAAETPQLYYVIYEQPLMKAGFQVVPKTDDIPLHIVYCLRLFGSMNIKKYKTKVKVNLVLLT